MTLEGIEDKVVLAFSGGLDTSFCTVYLSQERELEVHAVLVDTGGFSTADITAIRARALEMGASSFTCLDVVPAYYEKCLKYLIFGNVLKNNTYPLSVSAERVFQATAIAEYALKINAKFIAHGSTGAGNDQVRFDLIFSIFCPEIKILTPIRDLKLSREAEITYLRRHGFEREFNKAAYSVNKGLWGTSVGGKETLSSRDTLPEDAWPTKVSASEPYDLVLEFFHGELTSINGRPAEPISIIQQLEALAAPYGIGRDIHVGDTIIGIKGRVGFEAAAAMIIIKAHHLLEKHTLTKAQLNLKEPLASFYGNALHEGSFYEPAMRNIECFLTDSQTFVNGTVYMKLYPYRFELIGIESTNDLMATRFGSYGEMNNSWTAEDVKGFSKINGNQIMIHHLVNRPTVPAILGDSDE